MNNKILMGHGSGGRLSHDLIKDLILKKFDNRILRELGDSAVVSGDKRMAFTTDSFVVSPLFFPGGDIGKIAVCGTVNDLVMAGARPLYLSVGLILEEGLEQSVLNKILDSLAREALCAGVLIVAGDLKVVEKGACDKIFINTSGVGRIIKNLSVKNIATGDKVIVTGPIGQHGFAVLAKRKELDLGFNIQSDCASLNSLLVPLLKRTNAIRFMRDPTRGGLATALNEIAESTGFGIMIEEKRIPISIKVRAAAELLGIDPLYSANEGRAVVVVKKSAADGMIAWLQRQALGKSAQIIGSIQARPKGKVVLNTVLGTQRIIDMLTGEQLPRIC
jgi:hydrogenase expression/formation protein HypE